MASAAPFDPSLQTALLLIDNQRGIDRNNTDYWGPSSSNPEYEKNVAKLLACFRSTSKARNAPVHIFHVGHSSLSPKSPLHPDHPGRGIEFAPDLVPSENEPVFWKHVNSAFVGTKLEDALREKGVKQLVVAGLTTDHCVSTSVRMAANLGVVGDGGRIILAEDSTFTFAKSGYDAETVHGVSVATLKDEFAEIWRTSDIIDEMTRFGDAPN